MLHWLPSWTGHARALPTSGIALVLPVATVLWQKKTPRPVWRIICDLQEQSPSRFCNRELGGYREAPAYACSTKFYKHAELISRCSSRPGEGKSVHPCSWCSCRHCGSLSHAFGRQKPIQCSSINEQRNVAMPRDYLENPLRAA